MIENAVRPLNEMERALLMRLLEAPIAGRDRLIAQSRVAAARTLDEYGSFALEVPGAPMKSGVQTPCAEGQTQDRDDVPIWVTLFVRGGVLDEVEVVRADGAPLLGSVNIRNLDIFAPAQSKSGE